MLIFLFTKALRIYQIKGTNIGAIRCFSSKFSFFAHKLVVEKGFFHFHRLSKNASWFFQPTFVKYAHIFVFMGNLKEVRKGYFYWCQPMLFVKKGVAKLRPAQTLALAGPEAWHYNHPGTAPPAPRPAPPAANVCISYISAISQRNELKFCMIVI